MNSITTTHMQNSLISVYNESCSKNNSVGFSEAKLINEIGYRQHQLSQGEIYEIAHFVHKQLNLSLENTLYLSKKTTGLARSLIIDYSQKKYSILSKNKGKLQASGNYKKVTEAILVSLNEEVTVSLEARIVNKKGKFLRTPELHYENKYGDPIKQIVTYNLAGLPDRTSYIQEEYDGELNPEALNLKQKIQVLDFLGNKIAEMHEDEVVHFDIKISNVLIKHLDENEIKLKLTDFGHTHTIGGLAFMSYGTRAFRAPERLRGTTEDERAEDMYALGCLVYELVTHTTPEWGTRANVTCLSEEDRNLILLAQEEEYVHLLEDASLMKADEVLEKSFYFIIAGLLNPLPLERMSAKEFQLAVSNLNDAFIISNLVDESR